MTTTRDTMIAYAAACRRAAAHGAPPPDRPDLDLRGADLRGANLIGVDLAGADLELADLFRANLSGANLSGADLRRADITGAYIDDADLRRADLRGAGLRDAGLRRADLRGADLTRAGVTGADFRGADLRGVVGLPLDDAERLAIRRAVAEQIRQHPETHDQGRWHSMCNTVHCVAGWAVVLAGDVGRDLVRRVGTPTAAHLLLGGARRPSFDTEATREDIIRDLAAD